MTNGREKDSDEAMRLIRELELFKNGLTIKSMLRVAEGLSDLKGNGNALGWWFIFKKGSDGTINWIFGS